MDEVLIAKLAKCIAVYCPPIAQDPDQLRMHAIRICFFQSKHEHIMRRFNGQDVLYDLDRHLRLAEVQLKKLHNEHTAALSSLSFLMPAMSIEDKVAQHNGVQPEKWNIKKRATIERTNAAGAMEVEKKEEDIEIEVIPQNPNKLANRIEAISSLRSGIKSFKRSQSGQSAPRTTSEQTEPAAIASACRQTWRDVFGVEKVPKSPRANPLGPMARFIEAVYFALELSDPKNPIKIFEPNPVSALRFVDRIGGDEVLEISLTWD